MSATPFTADQETRVRECNVCDPEHGWVIARAHFGDGDITLRWYRHPSYRKHYGRSIVHYGVFGAAGLDGRHSGPYYDGGEMNDRDEAFASFERAQEWLITTLRPD